MDHTDRCSHAHRLLIEETRRVEAVRWTFPQPCIMLDACIVTCVLSYVYSHSSKSRASLKACNLMTTKKCLHLLCAKLRLRIAIQPET